MKKKVSYIHGAVTVIEKKEDIFEVTLHDNQGTFFCKKGIGLRVGAGYKIGLLDTNTKNRYEIVSVEQELITDPAFAIKGPQQTMIKMTANDYKELLAAKQIKIRTESLNSAIEICKHTIQSTNAVTFKTKVLEIAKELEYYFTLSV